MSAALATAQEAIARIEAIWGAQSPLHRPQAITIMACAPLHARPVGLAFTPPEEPDDTQHAILARHTALIALRAAAATLGAAFAALAHEWSLTPGFAARAPGECHPVLGAHLGPQYPTLTIWVRTHPHALEVAMRDLTWEDPRTHGLPGARIGHIHHLLTHASTVHAPDSPTWEARRTNRVEAAYKARATDPEDALRWILATQAHTLGHNSGSFALSQVVPNAHDMLSRIDRG